MKISLNEESGYINLLKNFRENQDKNFQDWLQVDSIFPHSGKQGLVGIVTTKTGEKMVFKISQYLNHLVQQELTIMKELNNITDFCPHFCRGIGGIIAKIDPTKRKSGNPFVDSNKNVQKEVLLMEYVKDSSKLYNYIKRSEISEDLLMSSIKQVLFGICIGQKKCNFSHYDLHSNNIMLKKCSKDLVFLYVFDEENQFCVPTLGKYPVIIDYGFSYAGKSERPLWSSLGHTEVGFMSHTFDPFADPKLFLVSVSKELVKYRGTKKLKKLRNITKKIFEPLSISWNCGWDKLYKKSALDLVIDKLQKYNKTSKFFRKYDYFCFELFLSLVILPIQAQNTENLEISYKTFLEEFSKIEKDVASPYNCIYILKGIVDIAREIHADYTTKNSRQHALDYFRQNFHKIVESVCSFCNPKIHYEKLLCSLFCLSQGIEGLLYTYTQQQIEGKTSEYRKMSVKSCEEIAAIIDVEIPIKYTFNDATEILIINCIKNECYAMKLDKQQTKNINEYDFEYRGTELYKIFSEKFWDLL